MLNDTAKRNSLQEIMKKTFNMGKWFLELLYEFLLVIYFPLLLVMELAVDFLWRAVDFLWFDKRFILFTLICRPLVKFSRSGNVKIVKLLLKLGFNPNKVGYGYRKDYIDILDADSVYERYNVLGLTPLMPTLLDITPLMATLFADIPIDKKKILLKLLLDNGAKIDDALVYGNHGKLCSWNPMKAACARVDMEIVQFLVEQGANINYVYPYGYSTILVQLAICKKEKEFEAAKILDYLIKQGANVNNVIRQNDRICDSALMFACAKGNSKIVNVLIKNGANINFSNGSCTALDLTNGDNIYDIYSYDIAKSLIINGAKFNYHDIPRLFRKMPQLEPKMLCATYDNDASKLNDIIKLYWREANAIGDNDPIYILTEVQEFSTILKKHILPNTPIILTKLQEFLTMLKKHILPGIQSEEYIPIKRQVKQFIKNSDELSTNAIIRLINISKNVRKKENLLVMGK